MRMRALALLLPLASCGKADPANQAGAIPGVGGPESGTRRPAPTIVIAATGPGGCAARWDGQPVTPEQIATRGSALVMQAVDAAGGAQRLTMEAIPVLDVEAPAGLSFACADVILFAVQRTGMASVRLRPTGRAAVLADFPLGEMPPPPVPMVLGVGAGGRLTWNDAPITPEALAARMDQMGSGRGPEPGEMAPPPGGPDLRPSREATFGQVADVLGAFRLRHIRPLLVLPSAEAEAEAAAAGPALSAARFSR
jgi:hypothetical protein